MLQAMLQRSWVWSLSLRKVLWPLKTRKNMKKFIITRVHPIIVSPVADPDGDSAADVPIVTLADTLAADRDAVTDTAVLLHPVEVTEVLQLDPAEVTGAASVAAHF